MNDFIPNDVSMPADAKRMKLLTGPNASGKTIYLKQVCSVRSLTPTLPDMFFSSVSHMLVTGGPPCDCNHIKGSIKS